MIVSTRLIMSSRIDTYLSGSFSWLYGFEGVLWVVYGGFLNANEPFSKLFRVNRAHFKSLLRKNFMVPIRGRLYISRETLPAQILANFSIPPPPTFFPLKGTRAQPAINEPRTGLSMSIKLSPQLPNFFV